MQCFYQAFRGVLPCDHAQNMRELRFAIFQTTDNCSNKVILYESISFPDPSPLAGAA